jgi:hypothetical protein
MARNAPSQQDVVVEGAAVVGEEMGVDGMDVDGVGVEESEEDGRS